MNRDSETGGRERTLSDLIADSLRMKGISPERLAQATGVSERFLESLLGGRFKELPPAPYVRGYLVKIAAALNLDGNELWREYLAESELVRRSGERDTLPENRFAVPRFNWKPVLIVLVGVIILGYVILRIPAFIDTYTFSVNIPENAVVTQAGFTIRGTVNRDDQLTMNSEVLYPDENGTFEKQVTLQPGWNTFEFQVKRLLAPARTFTKQIYYQTATSSATPTP